MFHSTNSEVISGSLYLVANINPKPIEKGEDSHIDAGYVSGDTVLGGAK